MNLWQIQNCISYGKLRLSAGKSSKLLLAPSKRKQLDELRNKNNNVYKQVLKTKHRVKCLEDQLIEINEKLNR